MSHIKEEKLDIHEINRLRVVVFKEDFSSHSKFHDPPPMHDRDLTQLFDQKINDVLA